MKHSLKDIGLTSIVISCLALGSGCATTNIFKKTANYTDVVGHNYYSKNDGGYYHNIDRRTLYEHALKEANSFYNVIDINKISEDEKKDLEIFKKNIQAHPLSDNEKELLKGMGLKPDKLTEKDLYFLNTIYGEMAALISGADTKEDDRIGENLLAFFLNYGKLF